MNCLLYPPSHGTTQPPREKIETLLTEPRNSSFVTLIMSGNTRELSLIRRILHASAPSTRMTSNHLNDIKLAVTEACTNVIRHAFNHDPTRTLEISMEFSKTLFQIKVRYDDPRFHPEDIPAPTFDRMQEGGWGVFIIRSVMDDVRYSKNHDSGNVELRMIKILHPEEGNPTDEN